jgi:hypothetical protein
MSEQIKYVEAGIKRVENVRNVAVEKCNTMLLINMNASAFGS